MAIDDVSFVNLRGEVISRNNLVQQMISYYQMKLDAGETKITDFNEGSEIRNLLESFAVDIYYLAEMEKDLLKNAFIDTAEGAWLDKHGMHPFIRLPRNNGSEAVGNVKFSIPSAITSSIIIPESTLLLSTENGLYYLTDGECSIDMGETETTIGVTCATVGSDGNCSSNTITVIDDSFFNNNMVSVTNEEACVNGEDYEDDEVYRERLLNFVRRDDFGSSPYYKNLCESLNGIHDVLFVDYEKYTKKIIVNGDEKPTTNRALIDVLTAVSTTANIILTHNFIVDAVSYTNVNLDIDLTVRVEMDSTIIENILYDYFDGGSSIEGFEFEGLNINESIKANELNAIFASIDNVQDVTITNNDSPFDVIPCDENTVLKLANVNITQSTIE